MVQNPHASSFRFQAPSSISLCQEENHRDRDLKTSADTVAVVDNTAIALGDAAKSMIMGVAVIRRDLRIAHAITSPFQPFSTMRRHANRSGSMLFVFVRQQRLGRLFVIVSRYR